MSEGETENVRESTSQREEKERWRKKGKRGMVGVCVCVCVCVCVETQMTSRNVENAASGKNFSSDEYLSPEG